MKGKGDVWIVESYTYDDYGNMLTITDGEGNMKTMTYDAFDHVLESLTAEGIKRKMEYDANNNKTIENVEIDTLHSVETKTQYNLLDKPVKVTSELSDSQSVDILTSYDKNENISEVIYPNGMKKTYAYDYLDQLVLEKTFSPDN